LKDVARGNELLAERERDLQNKLTRKAEEAEYYKATTEDLRPKAGMSQSEINDLRKAEKRRFEDA
jgi:hypothetical protein